MGHLHINTTDIPAHQRFWTALGGTPTKLGTIEGVRFPGVVVYLKQAKPAGGTEGSVIGHVAFAVKDLRGSLARWKERGIAADREPGQGARQAFVTAPDGIRVEITEDAALGVPIAHHHVHFYNSDVDATKAWYVKTFGAKPGKRGKFEAADIPGANLTFDKAAATSAPTRGRALDHIGFEVRGGLEAFAKKLEAGGIKLDVPYRKMPNLGIALVFLTDPWGTYIELTEPL
jgi:catechol 2,3-dioxygenase-like lactoylglutathione lyase family enzyme